MDWNIRTIEPDRTGMNYTALVDRPDGFKPKPTTLGAKQTGPAKYELEYVVDARAKAASDLWDTGIKFSNIKPRVVDIDAMVGGGSKKKDKPTVFDGSGGGGGTTTTKPKLIKVFKVGSFNRYV